MRKIIRPIIFLIGVSLIIALGGMLVAAVVSLTVGMPAINFIYPNSPGTVSLAIANAFFIIGIPLTMLIFAIMRVFMGSNYRPKWQFGLWAFWFINVIGAFAIGSFTVRQFSHSSSPQEMGRNAISLTSDTLFVEMERSPAHDAIIQFSDNTCISDGQLLTGHVNLNFFRSKTGFFEVEKVGHSRGKSIQEAVGLVEQIDFNYQVEGDRIILPSHFVVPEGTKWRGQGVDLNIYVPDGKFVKRDRRSSRFIHQVEMDEKNDFHTWKSGYLWQMTPAGMVAPELMKKTEQFFDHQGFSKIRVEGNINLRLKQGSDFNLKMVEGERHMDDVRISQNGDRLNLRTKNDHGPRMTFEVTVPTLEELWLISSRDVEVRDFNLEKLRLVNEGSGDLEVFADIDSLNVELSGRGEVSVRGNGTHLKGFVTDEARLEAEHFEVKNARVEVVERGRIDLAVSDSLRTNLELEDHSLKVRGNPVILNLDGERKGKEALEEE